MKAEKANQSQSPRQWFSEVHKRYTKKERVIIADNMNCTAMNQSYPTNPNPVRKAKAIDESGVFLKRIGSTNYRMSVHFSQTSSETMNDKILRLVKNEATKSKKEYMLDENSERILLKSGAFKSRKMNTTDWNERIKAEEWRRGWADSYNAALENQNHAERIDHRSYEQQGIDQIPTVHLSIAASAMEKRGIRTERGNINREIELTNKDLRQIKARIIKLQKWLKDEMENFEPAHPYRCDREYS